MRHANLISIMDSKKKPHRSNKELEKRKENEKKLKADSDKVEPPEWLSKEGRKEFRRVVKELKKIDIVTNLDINALAVYSDNVVKYYEFENQLERMYQLLNDSEEVEDVLDRIKAQTQIQKTIVNFTTKKLQLGDAIRKFSIEFGLTPQARAKLAIPKDEEKEEVSPFDKVFGAV